MWQVHEVLMFCGMEEREDQMVKVRIPLRKLGHWIGVFGRVGGKQGTFLPLQAENVNERAKT